MALTVAKIAENLEEAYPEDSFLVYKFIAPGGACWFHGNKLVDVKLDDGDLLRIYKLSTSSGSSMKSDEIKAKAFPFIYETKGETDNTRRRDKLRDSLKNVFPNHHVNVFILYPPWNRNHWNVKGTTSFKDEFGSHVDIVLN